MNMTPFDAPNLNMHTSVGATYQVARNIPLYAGGLCLRALRAPRRLKSLCALSSTNKIMQKISFVANVLDVTLVPPNALPLSIAMGRGPGGGVE